MRENRAWKKPKKIPQQKSEQLCNGESTQNNAYCLLFISFSYKILEQIASTKYLNKFFTLFRKDTLKRQLECQRNL